MEMQRLVATPRTCPQPLWLVARLLLTCSVAGGALGCSDDGTTRTESASSTQAAELRKDIGPEGGELVGEPGSPFAGVHVVIPAGALSEPTTLVVTPVEADAAPLPQAARACGPMFAIAPRGLTLALPAEITLPYDASIVDHAQRLPEDVRVWVRGDADWGRELQLESTGEQVRFELGELGTVAAGVNPPKPEDIVEVTLVPSAKNLPCIAQYPDDPSRAPALAATVVRGELSDTLFVHGENIAPGLAFDMFTVERSTLSADGKPAAGFSGFGLSWYQTDLEANRWGKVRAVIRTVLLDEIFGLDSGGPLGPTNTFHIGAWFNDPGAAVACGFDAGKPTPFNGEQQAGPLAFITKPDAGTGLGPLCTEADDSTTPPTCKK